LSTSWAEKVLLAPTTSAQNWPPLQVIGMPPGQRLMCAFNLGLGAGQMGSIHHTHRLQHECPIE
jgi:hypothetical protein